jgi:hypothetical protein
MSTYPLNWNYQKLSGKESKLTEITVEDMEKAETETWDAILAFAKNTDPLVMDDLSEDVSMALINLTNLCYLRGVSVGKARYTGTTIGKEN